MTRETRNLSRDAEETRVVTAPAEAEPSLVDALPTTPELSARACTMTEALP